MSTPRGTTPRAKAAKRQGRRVRALGDAFHRTVKWALRGVEEEQFGSCFQSLPYYYIPVLYRAYTQTLHQTRANVEAEFDACVEESRLADKLQDLEVLCEQQGIADAAASEDAPAAAAAAAAAQAAPDRVLRLLQHRALQAENQVLQQQLEAERARLVELDAQLAELQQAAQAQAEAIHKPMQALQRVHEASRMWGNRAEIVPVC